MVHTIIVGIIALILTYLYDRKVFKRGFLFAMILLTSFCAVRWEWGNDMPNYLMYFNNFGTEKINFWEIDKLFLLDARADRSNEIGWAILNLICQPIGFFGLTIVLSVFEGIVVYWFIKTYVPRGFTTLAVFLYVFDVNLMVLGCSAMRQWLAMCIILIAIHYAAKDKLLPFFISVVAAALFHTSAIVGLLMYPLKYLRNLKLTTKSTPIIVLVAAIWIFLFGQVAGKFVGEFFILGAFEQYEDYFLSREAAASVGVAALLNVIVVLLCVLFNKKSSSEVRSISWANVGYVLFMPAAGTIPLFSRILYYFEILSIANYPNAMKSNQNTLVKFAFILWLVFWNMFIFIHFFNNDTWRYSMLHYKTIFEAPYWQ